MNQSLYRVVELEQGTSAWREWRHRGIGSSDAPIIMGETCFDSVQQLLVQKRLPPREQTLTPAMIRGNELEPIARRAYEAKTEQKVAPKCLQSNLYPWLRASLDGITDNGSRVVEIKCGEVAYKYARQKQSVPPRYYAQLQHIMAVTGLPDMDLWCYHPADIPILLTVGRNEPYIRTMLKAEEAFWNRVSETYL